jgi:hypothetical protein
MRRFHESDTAHAMSEHEEVITRRTLLGAALLMTLASAAPAGQRTTSKRIALLTRPKGTPHAIFTRDWLVRARAAVHPAITRLVFSDVFAPSSTDVDCLVSYWFEGDQLPSLPPSPPVDATELPVSEHAFVPVIGPAPTVKRTLLIARKPGMSHAQFVSHWLDIHGPLSRGVPGLAGCVFNVIGEGDSARTGIDGVSESWWTGPGTEDGAKVASAEADRWAGDGDNFIDSSRTRLLICREHVLR